jgi:hypothetical protein
LLPPTCRFSPTDLQVVATDQQVVATNPQVVATNPQVLATNLQVLAANPQVVARNPAVAGASREDGPGDGRLDTCTCVRVGVPSRWRRKSVPLRRRPHPVT